MKKQAVINLTEYYYINQKKSFKIFSFVLIFTPLIITTLLSILKFSAYVSVIINTVKSGFSLGHLFTNVMSWNMTYNIVNLSVTIFKSFCFVLYGVGLYGVVKYRLKLNARMLVDLTKNRLADIIIIAVVLGGFEWLLDKIPFIGTLMSAVFSYFSVYAIVIFLENSNTLGVKDAIKSSWVYTFKNIVGLFMLDVYYLFFPTVIGISVIIITQILGLTTTLYFVTLFGVLIASIGVLRKLPKSYLSRIIYYLTNPIKR